MPLVRVRTLVSHAQFRKLPNGAIYYLSSNGTGPFVKTGNNTRLPTNSTPQETPEQTTVDNVGVDTIRVSKFVLNSQDAIGG